MGRTKSVVLINRAPVLTLWAKVVAERLGFDRDEALSLAKKLAGMNAQSKGRSLGIYKPAAAHKAAKKAGQGEEFWIDLCGRSVPAVQTSEGIRAVDKDKPVDPKAAARYLEQKFSDELEEVERAMTTLVKSFKREELAGCAYELYEKFRPRIPEGVRGWGAKGALDLDLLSSLGG